MPQLMPMSWNISFLLVILLFMMMIMFYFMNFSNFRFYSNKSGNLSNITIWKW